MSNDPSYLQVLRKIDLLREKGVADSDPEMMKLRMQLRDHLEKLNKDKPKTVVPTLMSIKTVKLTQSEAKPNPKTEIKKLDDPKETKLATLGDIKRGYAKYALLGVAIAVVALVYKWYRRDS